MSENFEVPKGWRKSNAQPQEPEIEWVSIEKLLDDYTIPILADAIKNHNAQVADATGRRILATNGDESDRHSKAFAILHLTHRYSMLQDPGPDDDLFYERLEVEGSPLDSFGWPKADLPDLSSINPHHSSNIKATVLISSADWQSTAQSVARDYLARHNAKDLHPSMKETSEQVAAELRKLKIYGPHKKPLESGYIKRHALQGEFWKNRHTY
jgi:hypothetical protein